MFGSWPLASICHLFFNHILFSFLYLSFCGFDLLQILFPSFWELFPLPPTVLQMSCLGSLCSDIYFPLSLSSSHSPPPTHTRKFLHVLSLFSPIYNFIVSYKPMKTHRIPQLFCLLISTHYVCLLAFDCSIVCILTKAPFFILHILAVQCKFAYHSKSLKWTWFIKTLDMWYKIITKQRDKKIDYFATLRKLAKYLKKIHTSHVLK